MDNGNYDQYRRQMIILYSGWLKISVYILFCIPHIDNFMFVLNTSKCWIIKSLKNVIFVLVGCFWFNYCIKGTGHLKKQTFCYMSTLVVEVRFLDAVRLIDSYVKIICALFAYVHENFLHLLSMNAGGNTQYCMCMHNPSGLCLYELELGYCLFHYKTASTSHCRTIKYTLILLIIV